MLSKIQTCSSKFYEQDFQKQKELFERAQLDFPDFAESAKDRLAEKYPKLYEHGKKDGPTNTEVIRELVIEKPELFPGAAKELQKVAIDNALFEKLQEKSPELAQQIESDSEKRKIALDFIYMVSPEEVEKATERAKKQILPCSAFKTKSRHKLKSCKGCAIPSRNCSSSHVAPQSTRGG